MTALEHDAGLLTDSAAADRKFATFRPGRSGAPASGPLDPPIAANSQSEPILTTGRIIGFVAMVLGMFMAILDIQIVAASLSHIQAGLSASPEEVSWVQTSYLIAEVIMIPLAAFMSRLLGTRPAFLIAGIGFTFFSFLAGLSQNMDQMILFRACQGFFGGALIPTVFATAFSAFPEKHRTTTTVIVSLIATLAPTIGPSVGGFITEALSWHWLFFVNIVPGIIMIALVWRFADFDRGDPSVAKGFDFTGLISMAVFLGSLQYALEEGPRNDWLDDLNVAIALGAVAIAGPIFLGRALTYFNPIVDLRPFRDRNFALGCALQFIVGVGLYGAVFLRPLFLSQVRGLGSLDIGVILVATGCAMFLAAPLAGRLVSLLDTRVQIAGGMCLAAYGFWEMRLLTPEWGFAEMFWPQFMSGAGLMTAMIPATRVAMANLPPAAIKGASSLYNLMRNLGGAVALAVLVQCLTNRTAFHVARLSENVRIGDPEDAAFLQKMSDYFTQAGLADPDRAAMAKLSGLVHQQATTLAFSDGFVLIAGAFSIGLALCLLTRPVRAPSGSTEVSAH